MRAHRGQAAARIGTDNGKNEVTLHERMLALLKVVREDSLHPSSLGRLSPA